MTVTAPPRPPRPSDPVDREELEAVVEALIEEARQRARRRRRIYAAVAGSSRSSGSALHGPRRAAQSQTASPALAARSRFRPDGEPKIAFIRAPREHGQRGAFYVMNADGSGQRKLAPPTAACLVARRAEDRLHRRDRTTHE